MGKSKPDQKQSKPAAKPTDRHVDTVESLTGMIKTGMERGHTSLRVLAQTPESVLKAVCDKFRDRGATFVIDDTPHGMEKRIVWATEIDRLLGTTPAQHDNEGKRKN